jgi:hypothetical protein
MIDVLEKHIVEELAGDLETTMAIMIKILIIHFLT